MDKRRVYVLIGFAFMLYNSLYQYSWNAIYPLLLGRFSRYELDVIFSTFVVVSSVAQVLGGVVADYLGVRTTAVVSALMASLGWLLSSFAYNLFLFMAVWAIGSAGEGTLYGIAVNLAAKWFAERRGFYVGLVSLGFGLGAVIANPLILAQHQYYYVALTVGLAGLVLLTPLGLLVSYPSGLTGKSPIKTVSDANFWFIYFSFVISTLPLLYLSSSLYEVVKGTPVEVLAISLFPLASGLGRPIFGRVSDSLGRKQSLFLVMAVEAVGVLALLGDPVMKLVGSILVGISGGAMLTLFMTFVTDVFGARYSTANVGILYTGKALTGVVLSILEALALPTLGFAAFPLLGMLGLYPVRPLESNKGVK